MRSGWWLGVLLLGAATLARPQAAGAQACAGDCNADASVSIDEVVLGVNVVLGALPLSVCAALDRDHDSLVDVTDLLASVSNLLTGCPVADPRIVQSEGGLLRGVINNRVRSFLGVPYAAPPVGELRWRAPHPPDGWSGIREASAPGSVCPQVIPFLNSPAGAEDCLFLNVHTPSPAPTTPLPVMVWIHGGAFTSGDGLQFGGTDGSDIVRRAGVIVVSLNYRLGALGFLAHRELTSQSEPPGNFGLQDQIAALQWVQRNIGAFGGDPGNVTIFGESAGGWSVCLHLVSPLSSGLFQRAIVQSGLCTTPLASIGAAEQQGERFAARLGCDHLAVPFALDCMRSKSADAVRAALPPDPSFAFSEGEFGSWSPIVDGAVIPEQPAARLAAGNFNRVPVLIGSNKDEGTLFVALSHDLAGRPLTAEQYPDRLRHLLEPSLVDSVVQQYPLDRFANPGEALSASFGDGFLACPSIKAAALLAPHVPTYLYQFEYPEAPFALPVEVPLGAFHSAEIQYVFGRRIGSGFNATERTLSQQLMGYWTRFAASGDPNDNAVTAWPLYGDMANYLVLDRQLATAQHPKATDCQFWSTLDYQRAPLTDPWKQRRDELDSNRAKWLSAGIDSYRMDYRRSCFCQPPGEVEITVRSGAVVSVRDSTTGAVVEPQSGAFGYNTIEALFEIIADAIDRRVASLAVAYDPQLGFPAHVAIDYARAIADDEIDIAVDEFQPLRAD